MAVTPRSANETDSSLELSSSWSPETWDIVWVCDTFALPARPDVRAVVVAYSDKSDFKATGPDPQ